MTAPGLVGHCVAFCRALREHGVPVTPAETVLAARTLALVDLADREDVRLGLRTVLVLQADHLALFDSLFDEMWGGGTPPPRRPRESRAPTPPPPGPARPRELVTLQTWMRGEDPAREQRVPVRQASDREALGEQDFSRFRNEHAAAFERLARQIARRLSLRPSRRWKAATHARRLDLRRTIRGSLRTAGEVVALEWRRRRIRRTRLVAICDVSGSMALYAGFLLQFLHALQNRFAHVETFLFSTRLTRTTRLLRHARWDEALSGVAREVTDWSGGTRIGDSLARFVEDWGRLVDRRTVVLVLSDGWDTGEPAVLGDAMARLHDRAGRVIWLNPLMASADYTPDARGMQAALPHIDLMAPVHNLQSLQRLVGHLSI